MPHEGFVSLVGAGPGDADHLTLGALKAIQGAQAVLYDALIAEDIIALLPERCIKIGVGKRGDLLSVSQDKTNALMVRLACKGLHVVRLKGGDPSVFGRVEEERQYLDQHGIKHKTIPGVTAASAAAAQFEFPLTHRGEARSLTFLTGRTKDGRTEFDDGLFADPQASLVFYMASHIAGEIQTALLCAGRVGNTPVIIVENAGRATAQACPATIATLADRVAEAAFDGPVLIGVGEAFRYARVLLSETTAHVFQGMLGEAGMTPVVILAGGSGARMGGNKPFHPYGETTLIEATIARLRPQAQALFINAGPAEHPLAGALKRLGFPLIFDGKLAGLGPLSGVLTALELAAAQGETAVITAPCDMPRLPFDMVAQLGAASGRADIVHMAGQRDYPLCSIWRVTVLPKLVTALTAADGGLPVMSFLRTQNTQRLMTEDDDAFVNINAPEAT